MIAKPAYRPDIDGLRAVAVLAVVLYHYGAAWLPGGFTGVDIFFVISGYLITAILRREIHAGHFSVLRFYDRRLRRILPALAVVLISTALAGWFILMPSDYAELGASGAYAMVGLGNLHFFWNTGYFDAAAQMQPLLHTWSLGVEEQFYVVWPLALVAIATTVKRERIRLSLIAALVLAGYAYAAILVPADPMAAFYLPHPRAWELGVGAIVAFAPPVRHSALSEAMSLAGTGLIAWSLLALSSSMPFPGLAATYACVGAALLVWPKMPTAVGKIMSLRPFVAIGLISYSLYLWHWPLLVLFRHFAMSQMPSVAEASVLVIASVTLAYLTWRFVEAPFRQIRLAPAITVTTAVAAIAMLAVASSSIHLLGGLPQRLQPKDRAIAAYIGYQRPSVNGPCVISASSPTPDCALSPAPSRKVLLFGDSLAGALTQALYEGFPDVSWVAATSYGCRPVLQSVGYHPPCIELVNRVMNDVIPVAGFADIIVTAQWKNGQLEQLPETVDYLQRFADRVWVIGPPVDYLVPLPDFLASKSLLRRYRDIAAIENYEDVRRVDLAARDLAAAGTYLSILDIVCPQGRCRTLTHDGVPMAGDLVHFTKPAAAEVVREVKRQGLLSTPP